MLTLQFPNSQLSLGGRTATADECSKAIRDVSSGVGRIRAELWRARQNIVLSVNNNSFPLHQSRVNADQKSSILKRNDPDCGYCDETVWQYYEQYDDDRYGSCDENAHLKITFYSQHEIRTDFLKGIIFLVLVNVIFK